MSVISHLEPVNVFAFFEQLSTIPHGSGNRAPVARWLEEFAQSRNLECHRDSLDNIIIIKPATPGYENSEPIILQAHTDMVCEKAPDVSIDFEKEAIELVIDGDFIRANGTTLGGDDGVGVALIMAVLDSRNIEHPRLEALFTSDEEIGMIGANDLDTTPLKGKRMINIDCEEEGVFTLGCAGGNVTKVIMPLESSGFDGLYYKINISGLCGGHSGCDIHRGRVNANVLMGRLLASIDTCVDLRIASISGGMRDNVIASSCQAIVAVDCSDEFEEEFQKQKTDYVSEYNAVEEGITLDFEMVKPQTVLSKDSTEKVITMLILAPDGIQDMSRNIGGLVQTSLNLGILSVNEKIGEFSYCVRSSVESQKKDVCQRLKRLATMLGGSVEIIGDYPAWEYMPESELRNLMVAVFEDQYGKTPELTTIHAGLECGILSSKISGLDCVAFGPDVYEVHTCRERMSISSVGRLWNMLVEVLKRMK
ncbi:MAG: aminoacyl-histidine dipeptidase [Ruminococcaceae bacterium]|nr:aminoacyl-histidine dipeptidase [Oscillospiraceae bacterium]